MSPSDFQKLLMRSFKHLMVPLINSFVVMRNVNEDERNDDKNICGARLSKMLPRYKIRNLHYWVHRVSDTFPNLSLFC
jgi:hypothetical protein